MTKRERVRRLLANDLRVGPAVSCWYHFPPECHAPDRAVDAHLRHCEKYDLDFIKVMTEVGYPRDVFGGSGVAESAADLRKLHEMPGDAPPFDTQLEIVRRLTTELGGLIPTTTTVFNAWATLRRLTEPRTDVHGLPAIEVKANPRDQRLTSWLREDASVVKHALVVIGRTLANFARACLNAGTDGIYLSVRDDWVDTPANRAALNVAELSVHDELVADTDREILAGAAGGWFNVLHLCGRPLRFERYVDNPHVQVVHWADRVTGPSIADGRRILESHRAGSVVPKAIAAGVNNLQTLQQGQPRDVAAEVEDAIATASGHPLIVAPGCTYDPKTVPDENIRALVAAVRKSTVS